MTYAAVYKNIIKSSLDKEDVKKDKYGWTTLLAQGGCARDHDLFTEVQRL